MRVRITTIQYTIPSGGYLLLLLLLFTQRVYYIMCMISGMCVFGCLWWYQSVCIGTSETSSVFVCLSSPTAGGRHHH